MLEVTACADESDELSSLEVYNTVWPHDAVTIGAVHSFWASAQDYLDCLVREDGVIVGSGVGAIFASRPRRVVTLITVLAGQRRRGAGTALYEAISRWASERGAGELEVSVADNDPESLSFARRRGFTEQRRQVGLALSLAGSSPLQVRALANGYTELHTSNEERNAPIQRLNARLGYRPGIGRIHLVGPSAPADPNERVRRPR